MLEYDVFMLEYDHCQVIRSAGSHFLCYIPLIKVTILFKCKKKSEMVTLQKSEKHKTTRK